MDRFLNGMLAWLTVCLVLLVVLAMSREGHNAPWSPKTFRCVKLPKPDGLPAAAADLPESGLPPMSAPPVPVRADPPRRLVTTVIVHHSASVHGDATAIDQWHRERGWNGVGYHYVITNGVSHSGQPCRDGEVQIGRAEDTVGAHARGRNQSSIGICMIGTAAFTPAQRRSLRALLVDLCRRHGITPGPATIQRHHEQCPGPSLDLGAIIAEVEGQLAHN